MPASYKARIRQIRSQFVLISNNFPNKLPYWISRGESKQYGFIVSATVLISNIQNKSSLCLI